MQISKCKGLFPPQIIPIHKQKYQQFKQVRKLDSRIHQESFLYSSHHRKYIGKYLPHPQFKTSRPPHMTIFKYTPDNKSSIFLFPLVGDPLSAIRRKKQQSQEIKFWIDKCGSLEEALQDVIRLTLRNYEQLGIEDIMLDCYRIYEGKLLYIYDSWMMSSYQKIKENRMEIENYYLSEYNLRELEKGCLLGGGSLKDFLFKIGLFILSLGTFEIKNRKYEYCQFKINKGSITQQLQLFKGKFKSVGSIVERFIFYQIQTINDLCKLGIDCFKKEKNYGRSLKKEKQIDKQNISILTDHQLPQKTRLSLAANQRRKLSNYNHQTEQKVFIKKKNMNKSVAFSQPFDSSISHYGQINVRKEEFNIKKRLSLFQPEDCIKMLQFLDLSEYIPSSEYERKVITTLDQIYVKNEWIRQIYSNGSIYFGEMQENKRNGKGMYLFDSDDFYIGDWADNKIDGFGTYIFKSGQLYKGELKNGQKQGFGRFHYQDGKIYEGYWKNNNKIGLGCIEFPNGVKFYGLFKQQKEITQGVFTRVEGEEILQYNGCLENYDWEKNEFKNNIETKIKKVKLKQCKIDQFQIFNEEGKQFYGECIEGVKNGFGIQEKQNEIYEGEWRNNKEEGSGKLHITNRFTIEGQWKDGFLVCYKMK